MRLLILLLALVAVVEATTFSGYTNPRPQPGVYSTTVSPWTTALHRYTFPASGQVTGAWLYTQLSTATATVTLATWNGATTTNVFTTTMALRSETQNQWVFVELPWVAVTSGTNYVVYYTISGSPITFPYQNPTTPPVLQTTTPAFVGGTICNTPVDASVTSATTATQCYIDIQYAPTCGTYAYVVGSGCSTTVCSPSFSGPNCGVFSPPAYSLFEHRSRPRNRVSVFIPPLGAGTPIMYSTRYTLTTSGRITQIHWLMPEAMSVTVGHYSTSGQYTSGAIAGVVGWNTFTLPTPVSVSLTHPNSIQYSFYWIPVSGMTTSNQFNYAASLTDFPSSPYEVGYPLSTSATYASTVSYCHTASTPTNPPAPLVGTSKSMSTCMGVSTAFFYIDFTLEQQTDCFSLTQRNSTVAPTRCVPTTCSSPFKRNTTSDDCDACLSTTTYSSSCTLTCSAPANSVCDAGYYGTGGFTCNAPLYRTNTVTLNSCTLITCPAPYIRNTTTDLCNACPPQTYGSSCTACVTPANATCASPGYYGSGGFACDPGFRTNVITPSTCTPTTCAFPFVRAADDTCASCAPGYYSSACVACAPVPANASCADGYMGSGAFVCDSGFRQSVVTPNECTPTVCAAPFARNVTTDRCDACSSESVYGSQCTGTCDAREPWRNLACSYGYYAQGLGCAAGTTVYQEGQSCVTPEQTTPVCPSDVPRFGVDCTPCPTLDPMQHAVCASGYLGSGALSCKTPALTNQTQQGGGWACDCPLGSMAVGAWCNISCPDCSPMTSVCTVLEGSAAAATNGTCVCRPNFERMMLAMTCDCNATMWGANCTNACPACGTRQHCDSGYANTGTCVCDAGFTGASCELCVDPLAYGPTCSLLCPSTLPLNTRCDNGTTGLGVVCESANLITLSDQSCDCPATQFGPGCGQTCAPTTVRSICSNGLAGSGTTCIDSLTFTQTAPNDGSCPCAIPGDYGSQCQLSCACSTTQRCDDGVSGVGCLDAPPGSHVVNNTFEPCPAGTSATAGVCEPCALPTYSEGGASACASCSFGYSLDALTCTTELDCSQYDTITCGLFANLCHRDGGVCAQGPACPTALGCPSPSCIDYGGSCVYSNCTHAMTPDVCAESVDGGLVCEFVSSACRRPCLAPKWGSSCQYECVTDSLRSTCSSGYDGLGTVCIANATQTAPNDATCPCNTGYYGDACQHQCPPDTRVNAVTGVGCTPSVCVFPFQRNAATDECTQCAPGYWGSACTACNTPANAQCNDGYSGDGSFVCVPLYRVSTIDPSTCTPTVCEAPFARNTTTDRCDACASGYGSSCTGTCDTREPWRQLACDMGFYGQGLRCVEGASWYVEGQSCVLAGQLMPECPPNAFGSDCTPCPTLSPLQHAVCASGYNNSGALSCANAPLVNTTLQDGSWMCECSVGYGAFCSDACPACEPSTSICSGGVDATEGTCNCKPGFVRASNASACDCPSGFFGSSCQACPVCGPRSSCDDGIAGSGLCACDAGFAGATCDECANPLESCSPLCPTPLPDHTVCTPNGLVCDAPYLVPRPDGSCECAAGTFGVACNQTCGALTPRSWCLGGLTGTGATCIDSVTFLQTAPNDGSCPCRVAGDWGETCQYSCNCGPGEICRDGVDGEGCVSSGASSSSSTGGSFSGGSSSSSAGGYSSPSSSSGAGSSSAGEVSSSSSAGSSSGVALAISSTTDLGLDSSSSTGGSSSGELALDSSSSGASSSSGDVTESSSTGGSSTTDPWSSTGSSTGGVALDSSSSTGGSGEDIPDGYVADTEPIVYPPPPPEAPPHFEPPPVPPPVNDTLASVVVHLDLDLSQLGDHFAEDVAEELQRLLGVEVTVVSVSAGSVLVNVTMGLTSAQVLQQFATDYIAGRVTLSPSQFPIFTRTQQVIVETPPTCRTFVVNGVTVYECQDYLIGSLPEATSMDTTCQRGYNCMSLSGPPARCYDGVCGCIATGNGTCDPRSLDLLLQPGMTCVAGQGTFADVCVGLNSTLDTLHYMSTTRERNYTRLRYEYAPFGTTTRSRWVCPDDPTLRNCTSAVAYEDECTFRHPDYVNLFPRRRWCQNRNFTLGVDRTVLIGVLGNPFNASAGPLRFFKLSLPVNLTTMLRNINQFDPLTTYAYVSDLYDHTEPLGNKVWAQVQFREYINNTDTVLLTRLTFLDSVEGARDWYYQGGIWHKHDCGLYGYAYWDAEAQAAACDCMRFHVRNPYSKQCEPGCTGGMTGSSCNVPMKRTVCSMNYTDALATIDYACERGNCQQGYEQIDGKCVRSKSFVPTTSVVVISTPSSSSSGMPAGVIATIVLGSLLVASLTYVGVSRYVQAKRRVASTPPSRPAPSPSSSSVSGVFQFPFRRV